MSNWPARAPELDVIVRTLADRPRAESLFRALDTVRALPFASRAIVIANGPRCDAAVLETLRARADVELIYSPIASASNARVLGRRAVVAPLFTFLDDDDELLSANVAATLAANDWRADEWDVLIANRLRERGGKTEREHPGLLGYAKDPLLSLLQNNWLGPGAVFYRTQRISVDLIDVGHGHHEWTHIAFRIARDADIRLRFIDRPTAIYHDTPESMSKHSRHYQEELKLLAELKSEQGLDSHVRARLSSKYANSLHMAAAKAASGGDWWRAWQFHLKSLRPPHTLKYLLYTRKLLHFKNRSDAVPF
jgi:hypothetical protein